VIRLALLRHATSLWNERGLIQGQRDIALSEAGRWEARSWHLPAALRGWRVYSSPLWRARETARLLGLSAELEPALLEAQWGIWEGRSLAELRADGAEEFRRAETLGLDFRPPGGESPRLLQRRLGSWLAAVAVGGDSAVAVTHRGVIRALYSLATGWDMRDKAPHRLERTALQIFSLGPEGRPSLERLNEPLA